MRDMLAKQINHLNLFDFVGLSTNIVILILWEFYQDLIDSILCKRKKIFYNKLINIDKIRRKLTSTHLNIEWIDFMESNTFIMSNPLQSYTQCNKYIDWMLRVLNHKYNTLKYDSCIQCMSKNQCLKLRLWVNFKLFILMIAPSMCDLDYIFIWFDVTSSFCYVNKSNKKIMQNGRMRWLQ